MTLDGGIVFLIFFFLTWKKLNCIFLVIKVNTPTLKRKKNVKYNSSVAGDTGRPQGHAETLHKKGTEMDLSPLPPFLSWELFRRGGLGSLTHLCVPGTQHRPGPEPAIGEFVVTSPWEQRRRVLGPLSLGRWHQGHTEEGAGARRGLNTGCPRPSSGGGWGGGWRGGS